MIPRPLLSERALSEFRADRPDRMGADVRSMRGGASGPASPGGPFEMPPHGNGSVFAMIGR